MMTADQMHVHIYLCTCCKSRHTIRLARNVARDMLGSKAISQRQLNAVRKFIAQSH